MNNTKTNKPTNIYKVSIQLSENKNENNNIKQDRNNLCYSSSLKKRSQTLNHQKNQIYQIIEKSYTFFNKNNCTIKNMDACFRNSRKKYSQPMLGSTNNINYRHQLVKTQKNIQRIEINTQSLQINNKSKKKNIKKQDNLDQYGTITSQLIEEDNKNGTIYIEGEQLMKTCPDFGFTQQNNSENISKKQIKRIHNLNNGENQTNFKISPKKKGRSLLFKTENITTTNNNEQNKPNISDKARSLYKLKNITTSTIFIEQQSIQTEPIKSQMLTTLPTRIIKAQDTLVIQKKNDNEKKSMSHFSKSNKKSQYKVNCINMSEHFENKMKDKNGGFNICKKMTMSTLNKYYQLCIQQIKDKQLQRRQVKTQKKQQKQIQTNKQPQKNLNQVLKQINIMKQTQNLKKNKSTQNITYNNSFKYKKHAPNKNLHTYNIGVNINQSQQLKNNNHKFIITDGSIPLLTATKIQRIHPHIENNIWVEIKKTIQDDERLGFGLCTKKQIIERVKLIDPSRKNIYNNYERINKKQSKQKNPQQVEENNQVFYPMNHMTKMSRSISMKNKNIDDAPLDAWDMPKQPMDVHHLHHNNQFHL